MLATSKVRYGDPYPEPLHAVVLESAKEEDIAADSLMLPLLLLFAVMEAAIACGCASPLDGGGKDEGTCVMYSGNISARDVRGCWCC